MNVPDTSGLPHSTGVPGDGSTGHGTNPTAAGATPRPSTQSETVTVPETGTGVLPDVPSSANTPETAPSATPHGTTGQPTTAAGGQGNTSATSDDVATRPNADDQDGTVTTDENTGPAPSPDEAVQP
ncbi:hypothetical protein EHS43_45895, partial [Streptomyces sp. RP5T]